MLPRIIALIAAARCCVVLLVKAGGSWSDSIDTAFFRTVLLAGLKRYRRNLSVFSRRYLSRAVAILSEKSPIPSPCLPTTGFRGLRICAVTDAPGEEDVQGENADNSEKAVMLILRKPYCSRGDRQFDAFRGGQRSQCPHGHDRTIVRGGI